MIRFVSGKSWNLPCIVEAVAERLEYFTPEGAPRRSWLRMRLVRVAEPQVGPSSGDDQAPQPPLNVAPEELPTLPASEDIGTHEILAGGGGEQDAPGGAGERLDELAARYYGDPSLWRLPAAFNDVDDPLRLAAGRVLRVPPPSSVTRAT